MKKNLFNTMFEAMEWHRPVNKKPRVSDCDIRITHGNSDHVYIHFRNDTNKIFNSERFSYTVFNGTVYMQDDDDGYKISGNNNHPFASMRANANPELLDFVGDFKIRKVDGTDKLYFLIRA